MADTTFSTGTVIAADWLNDVNDYVYQSATSGQLRIGNGSGFTIATLTAGSGITITNGAGSITIAASGVTSFNTRTGAVTLTSGDVTGALTYTPASSGANSDITSITGLTTALTVAQGGTGAGTFTDGGVLVGNSTGVIQATAVGTAGHVLTSNGAGSDPTFQAVPSASVGDHYVDVSTGNGHGSTNTVIRRFTTTVGSAGTAITYADSAPNGGTFTINEAGMYAIFYSERTTSSGFFGVSVNSNQLTTGIPSITASHRVALSEITTASTGHDSASCVVRLAVNDVVRAHTEGNMDGSTGLVRFTIRKVGPA